MASSAVSTDPKKNETQNKRVDWKKQKELEEARKAGTAPPEVDEEGRDINPHIPQYITSVPWYVGENRPTLKHQRVQPEKIKEVANINAYYKKGVKEVSATKFRKGACQNCGALTHKKKDCLERPRRVGAKFSGEDIKPDELLPGELKFDFDGKRDRWAAYDVKVHHKVLEEYARVDEAKRQLKAAKLEEELESGNLDIIKTINKEDDEEEDKYADQVDMPGQKFDSNVRQTVRNLRIREDTAKYLHNLDQNSAFYDPKTRSMRESPFNKNGDKGKNVNYYGDNFVRASGNVKDVANAQLFAWEAYEQGSDVHLQADPTKLELLHKTYKVKKDNYKEDQKEGVLAKYGGAEHLEAPPKELLLAQTEEYVEYSRTGKVVKGQEKAIVSSKYEEDVYLNNHTSVWGSFWETFRWGYACCHSFIKQSYCTGEAGKVARNTDTPLDRVTLFQRKGGQEEDKEENEEEGKEGEKSGKKSLVEMHREKLAEEKSNKKKNKKKGKDDDDEDGDKESKKEKLRKALEAEDERNRKMDEVLKLDERKRGYNSLNLNNAEPTVEEMEAYRMKRSLQDDPMAQFMKKKR
ncbi:pre-mRNA-splicing factor SLU7-like [Clytia hemisphaerica]|uniref:Pre-mRNA-splicing factor SLU7 n=1 Tax=Clytia hemisphaerica TaxID=252671 RepID=A0A7M5X5S3_9CNID